VSFVLDEVATLGHLEVLENAVGLTAGYGIQLTYVFQDIGQMRDLYKGRWASFISNAGIRAVFNLDDHDTAKYWSDTLGARLVETVSQNKTNEGLVSGHSASDTMRPLMPADEIMLNFSKSGQTKDAQGKIEWGNMLILAQAAHPVITDRVPYFDDPELKGRWVDPRFFVPEFSITKIMPAPPEPEPPLAAG